MGARLLMAFLTTPWRKMTNTKNGKTKMHAILLCWMDRQPTKLRGRAKHVEPRHGYDGMSGDVVNQGGKH
jgi:hypothetical protein